MKKQQRLKLGLQSGIIFVIVLAILVAVNILADKLNVNWDLSKEKIYSVSDQTISIVNALETDVTIYVLGSEEDFPIGYKQLLSEYAKNSSHIEVAYRSLDVYPGFASQYMTNTKASVKENSLIVVSGDKHVYLDSDEFVSTDGTSVEFEPMVTSAINTVTDGETKKLYYINGHNELELLDSTKNALLRDNYEANEIILLNEDIPEDADIVLINAPTEDYSKEECKKLKDYVEQGGNIYFIVEATIDLDNLYEFAKDCGIEICQGVVMEQSVAMIYGETPTYILPLVQYHEITKDFDSTSVPLIVLVSKGLKAATASGYTETELLVTSDYAYSKVNLDSDYVSREDDDIVGPFSLAMLSEREDGGKLIVLGSSNVLNDQADELVGGRNTDFVMNGINYLMGDTNKISIRSKTIEYSYNTYTTQQVYVFTALAVLIIPLVILIAGIVIVVIRNGRSKNWKKASAEEEGEEDKDSKEDDEVDSTEAEDADQADEADNKVTEEASDDEGTDEDKDSAQEDSE